METVYCGVDLHYARSTFRFLNERGETKQAVEVETNKESIESLLNSYQDYNIAYAFEAGNMAGYFNRIVNARSNTQKVHVVHPLKFKVITESKHKNDKEDSLKLATGLLKDYLPKPVYMKNDLCRQIKTLLNLRRRMIGTRSKIILQAKSILRGLGIKECRKDLKTAKGFARVIGRLGNEPFYKQVIEGLAAECFGENDKVAQKERQIMELIENNFKNEYEWLISIPCISFVTAATVLSVIEDIGRFEKAGQFSSYCGLIPSEHSSGEKTTHGRITKEGVKELRSLLVQAAWAIIRWKKPSDERLTALKKKYHRMAYKQKSSQKAATAIARHLSRIVFGVLKSKAPYCGKITNRAKACD